MAWHGMGRKIHNTIGMYVGGQTLPFKGVGLDIELQISPRRNIVIRRDLPISEVRCNFSTKEGDSLFAHNSAP